MAITIEVSDLKELMVEFTKEVSRTSRDMEDLVEENERLRHALVAAEDRDNNNQEEIESLKGDSNYYKNRCADLRNDLNAALEKIRNSSMGIEAQKTTSATMILDRFLHLLRNDQDKARAVLDLLYEDSTEWSNKICKIKTMRELLNIGLKEAKEFVEGTYKLSEYVSFR